MRTGRIEMGKEELLELELLLYSAEAVVPMIDAHRGRAPAGTIALRHDVDASSESTAHALETALAFARWENERGFRSTFFLLHSAPYWSSGRLLEVAAEMDELGHEIGIHVNAIATALREGSDPEDVLERALAEIRSTGIPVVGAVAHGDPLCYRTPGQPDLEFVNDEIFEERARPAVGAPDRIVHGAGSQLRLVPFPLADFGLEYESNRIPRDAYLSDSGSTWKPEFDHVVRSFEDPLRLHLLVHPDWWAKAFSSGGSDE